MKVVIVWPPCLEQLPAFPAVLPALHRRFLAALLRSVAGLPRRPPRAVPQIPRLYNVYKETGVIENFQQMLENIFEPLFEVTKDPSSHPQLHVLLSQVGNGWGRRQG